MGERVGGEGDEADEAPIQPPTEMAERLRSDVKLPGAAIVAAPATPPATTDLTIIAGRDYAAALTAPSPVSTGSPKM